MEHAFLERRLERERRARAQAEKLLEDKSRELFHSNQKLLAASQILEYQSKELNAILDHADISVLLVDDHGLIQRGNAAAAKMFDRNPGELHGTRVDAIMNCSPDVSDLEKPISQEIVTIRKRHGDSFEMELSIVDVAVGDALYSLWLCRDISRRVAAEQNRLRLEHELAQAQRLEALGVMASGIAHEINTPIQYVRDNVQFLDNAINDLQKALSVYQAILELLDCGEAVKASTVASLRKNLVDIDLDFILEEIPDALVHTSEGLEQISKIVGAVKSFSHPGSKTRTPIDINTLLNDVLTVTRNQWKYVAELETSFADDIPEILVFPSELNQVFMNLIVNAAHAIEEAGRDTGIIRAETSLENSYVRLCIKDNGCGIPEENSVKIFEPFFTTKEVGKGTGQGLSFCHQIITQRHGGKISVKSEVDRYTTFTIHLPVSRSEQNHC